MDLGEATEAPQVILTAISKEALQKRSRFVFKHTRRKQYPVIQRRMVKHIKHAAGRTRTRVVHSEYEALNARMKHCPGTHGTGLERAVQSSFRETMPACPGARITQRDNFSMCRTVVEIDGLVMATANNNAIIDKNGTHRNFAPPGCLLSQR